MGIPPKEPPTHIQTHSVSQNQSRTLSLTQRLNPSQNFPLKKFSRTAQKIFAGIHRKGEFMQKDQVVQDFDSVEEYHNAQ